MQQTFPCGTLRPLMDDHTTLVDLRRRVAEFVATRDWEQFHTPKNLSASIAIEAAELLEHFQWLTIEQATTLVKENVDARQAITEELADVLIYCLSLADILDCDVGQIIFDKLAKNEKKYPL